MYQVYFEDKMVSFSINPHPGCDALLMIGPNEVFSPAKMIEKLGNNKHLCIKTQSPKKAFLDFCSQFRQVEAAGGVVENGDGQTLMILRRGKWDLPKGHVERGENRAQSALREVTEETGIESVFLGDPLTETLHFYPNNGEWEMKRTFWYSMRSEEAQLSPQTEEDITKAGWFNNAEVRKNAAATFSSIKEVLRQAGKL